MNIHEVILSVGKQNKLQPTVLTVCLKNVLKETPIHIQKNGKKV